MPKKETADYFSVKKIRITFILAILVFTIHISSLYNYSLDNELGVWIVEIQKIINAFARVAVPLFFIISGVLFYRNYSYDKTISKWKSRMYSLVIPYFVWNCIWFVFEILCSYTPISNYYIGRKKIVLSIETIWRSCFLGEVNPPFWFIYDLIVFVLICPLIYTVVRHRIWGIFAITAVYIWISVDGKWAAQIFQYSDAILYYLVGSYIGVHFFEKFKERVAIKSSFLYCGGIVICTWLIYKDFIFIGVINIRPIILILFALMLWRLFDIFENRRYYRFEQESFLVYAMHMNVSAVITKIIYFLLPKVTIFSVINYLATLVVTIFLIVEFAFIIRKYLPKIGRIITGR